MSNILSSPYGMRGELPFHIYDDHESVERMKDIPGCLALPEQGKILTPWDLAKYLDPKIQPIQARFKNLYTGIDRFKELGFHKIMTGPWAFQQDVVRQLAPFDYRQNSISLRGGKTLTSFAAATLRGARKFAIFMPGRLKSTWLWELRKWVPDVDILYLEGRSAKRGTLYQAGQDRKKLNFDHISELIEVAHQVDILLCNFDILVGQFRNTGSGQSKSDNRLMGMFPILKSTPVDVILIDEAHEISAQLSRNRDRMTRGEILHSIYRERRMCKLCYLLSATPIRGGKLVRFWQLARIMAGGKIWGEKHWRFSVRYCGGGHVPNTTGYGSAEIWKETGLTNQDEFKARWASLVYQKSSEELGMPLLKREVVRINPGDKKWRVPKNVLDSGTGKTSKRTLAERAALWKAKEIVPEVRKQVELGKKVFVVAHHRKPVHEAGKQLSKLKKEISGLIVHVIDGTTKSDIRDQTLRDVGKYDGPAIVVATVGSIQGGYSTQGIYCVHVIELDPDPTLSKQAEGRGAERGQDDIRVMIWVIEGSYDSKMAEIILPKLEALQEIEGSVEATQLIGQLVQKTENELSTLFSELAGTVSSEAEFED